MSDALRCEPPPELRGVDGWHWVSGVNNYTGQLAEFPAYWTGTQEPMSHMWRAWGVVHEPDEHGWRYIAPAATPAEVEALRAELKRCETACFDVQADNVALRRTIQTRG